MKLTSITLENHKEFIGKKVEVEITCYEVGVAYPDNNILLGMVGNLYKFISEKGTEDEQEWSYEADGKNTFIQVFDFDEYNAILNVAENELSSQIKNNEIDIYYTLFKITTTIIALLGLVWMVYTL